MDCNVTSRPKTHSNKTIMIRGGANWTNPQGHGTLLDPIWLDKLGNSKSRNKHVGLSTHLYKTTGPDVLYAQRHTSQ